MMSKRSEAIAVMKENATLPMRDVVALIADRIGVTDANAKSYYRYIVQHGMAPGSIEKTDRAPKTPKAPKATKPKMIKAKPIKLTDKPKVTDKTVEELADIRAKNLARLKAVGRKYAKGQYAEPRVSDEPFDESAVPNLEAELDSFKAPKFLTVNQVKSLV
jgi:hypothetical protein